MSALLLKSSIIGLTAQSRSLRNMERKALHSGRYHKSLARENNYVSNIPENSPEYKEFHGKNPDWKPFSEEEVKQFMETEEFHYLRYFNLHHKRVNEIRKKSRINYIAYAFLRNVPYEKVEFPKRAGPVNWTEVEKIVFDNINKEDDPRVIKQRYEQWLQEATKSNV